MTPLPISSADPKTRPRPRKGQAVEFVRGAVRDDSRWLLSVGIHDKHSEIHAHDHAAVEAALGRVTPPPWFAHRAGSWDESVFLWVLAMDEYRLRQMPRLDGGTVLDIGGHIGSFVLVAHDRGAAVIHSYEPDPDSFARLAANCARIPGATAVNAAVGAAAGTCRMRPYGGNLAETGAFQAVVGEGTTPVVGIREAIDRACAASRDGWIDLIKLDCEGAELPILEGPGLDLSGVRRIVGEFHSGPKIQALYGRDLVLRDVAPLLARHGFRVTALCDGTAGDGLFWAERAG